MAQDSKYGHLTRAELEARLAAAEDVVALYAWSPAYVDGQATEAQKACYEKWSEWRAVAALECTPKDFPHLTDDVIAGLAAKRDSTRRAVMARLVESY